MQEPPHWRNRVQEIYKICQEELKRTTEIGKKMLDAGKANSGLRGLYEELGLLTVKSLREGQLNWDDPKVKELLEKIGQFEQSLDEIESDVNRIRFSEDTDS